MPSKNEWTLAVLIQHIVPILFSLILPLQMQREPPSDFDFRFRYGICSTDELDTFTGWFTRKQPDGTTTMAQLFLNAAHRRHLYETVEKINFFSYPSIFRGEPGPGIVTTSVPSIKYQIDVRSEGRMHSVQWDDDQAATGVQADGLRSLFGWAVAFINNAAEVRRLPPPAEPCGRN